jgi:hypothetical protein
MIPTFRPNSIQDEKSKWPHATAIFIHQYIRFMVFNANFNNISVISWLSVLLVEKTGVRGENYISLSTLNYPYATGDLI